MQTYLVVINLDLNSKDSNGKYSISSYAEKAAPIDNSLLNHVAREDKTA